MHGTVGIGMSTVDIGTAAGVHSIGSTPRRSVLTPCERVRVAVGQGFEPREVLTSTVFKTAALDHSASPPQKRFRNNQAIQPEDSRKTAGSERDYTGCHGVGKTLTPSTACTIKSMPCRLAEHCVNALATRIIGRACRYVPAVLRGWRHGVTKQSRVACDKVNHIVYRAGVFPGVVTGPAVGEQPREIQADSR